MKIKYCVVPKNFTTIVDFLNSTKIQKKKYNKNPQLNMIEVREDEEQTVKFGEIIELLVNAGYYRARIKGLTNFDKIIGGMTWCIESCTFGLDIDILFQENLTIGQKLALTEKIVAMLPRMKCPHKIEPHQIQGLDCIHIFPVIQWLVEQSMKTRKDLSNYVRLFANEQFCKKYEYSASKKLLGSSAIHNITSIKKTYGPRRRFLQKNIISDEFSIVSNALLEYGEILRIPQSVISKLQEVKSNNVQQDTEITKDMIEQKIQEKKKVEELMENLYKFDDEWNYVSSNLVAKIAHVQAKEIANAVEQVASSTQEQSQKKRNPEKTFIKQNTILRNHIEKLLQKKDVFNQENQGMTSHLHKLRNEKQEVNSKLSNSLQLYGEKKSLNQLQELLIIHDGLKSQENKFRERCRFDLIALRKLVENIEKRKSYKKENCVSEYESQKETINRLRLQLAKKSRLIATLLRQLDDVPGRSELSQYQRRFIELYNQVSTKHRETKQYYTLYNTLDDTQLYLNKELTLLHSIQDNYTEAMTSSNNREQFIKQFELIVAGVDRNKVKIQKRCTEEKSRRDALSRQLVTLMELQRKYVSAVRQLTAECRENEYLLAQLRGP